jgi:prophage DNA circulation protein
MAWSETLLDCSFRGVRFEVLRTQDSADRSTAEHSYPYIDGADIQDLGRGPRVINLDAYFYGDNYETQMRAVLAALDKPGAGELVHPVFGSIAKAQLRRYQLSHDADHVDQCVVSLEFVESTPGNPFFDRSLPSQRVDNALQKVGTARSALANALGNVITALRSSNAMATLNDLRENMLGPILAAESQVHGVLLSGLDVLAFPRAWANDVSSIVDGILNLRDFGDNLVGDWQYSANMLSAFDVFSSGGSAAQIAPAVVPSESQAVVATQAHLAASTACGVAQATALVLTAEADPEHGATLSPPEIENVVNAARERIDDALDAIRAIYPLETARTLTEPMKDLALALQEAARAIIEARPPLVQKTAGAPANLRLIAHAWYGDHTRAIELLRLNPSLRLPNNLMTGDQLNAYAQ